MVNNTGLSERSVSTIISILKKYPHIIAAFVFGSRAKGNYREGSDIDLCIKTDTEFTHTDFLHLNGDFDDSSLPYTLDIEEYDKIQNAALKQHIDQVSVEIYRKG